MSDRLGFRMNLESAEATGTAIWGGVASQYRFDRLIFSLLISLASKTAVGSLDTTLLSALTKSWSLSHLACTDGSMKVFTDVRASASWGL